MWSSRRRVTATVQEWWASARVSGGVDRSGQEWTVEWTVEWSGGETGDRTWLWILTGTEASPPSLAVVCGGQRSLWRATKSERLTLSQGGRI